MQRPLEARVRKVLAAGEDWRGRHGRGRHAYLLHATRVSRDSRHVHTSSLVRVSHCVASRVSVDRMILFGPSVYPVLPCIRSLAGV
jgi:hypothetical protein